MAEVSRIEEAKAVLDSRAKTVESYTDKVPPHLARVATAIRVVLTALATAEAMRDAERAKVAEAVRIMKPWSEQVMFARPRTDIREFVERNEIVDRQKVDGGARG